MCSIVGAIYKHKMEFSDLRYISSLAWERGKDNSGMVHIRDSKIVKYTDIGMTTFLNRESALWGDIVIINHRATPTTEIVSKNFEDTPPFVSRSRQVIVALNGIISNDKELREKHNLSPLSSIDTATVSELVDKIGIGKCIEQLESGFALATYNEAYPYAIILVNNFKPIYTYETDEAIYFASLEEFLKPICDHNRPKEVGPYGIVGLTVNGIEDMGSIMPEVKEEKCLVIASSGLDSTTVIGIQKEKYEIVDLVHFVYGCKAQNRELDRIVDIAKYYNSNLYVIDLTSAFNNIESSLFGEKDNIAGGIEGTERSYEWVPARNLVFLSHAVALAESKGYNVISTGTNLEESSSYPDNEENMFIKLNDVLYNAVNWNKRIRIENPLSCDMKHDIVRQGLELGIPYHLTYSCYRDEEYTCGNCGPCSMRRIAFERNGTVDPLIAMKEENDAM